MKFQVCPHCEASFPADQPLPPHRWRNFSCAGAPPKIYSLGDRWPWPLIGEARREGSPAWFETCERVSNDQRDCVPPLTLRTRTHRAVGFFTGEAASHDERGVPVHAAHIAINGRHFVREVAIDQIDQALSELITALGGAS